MEYTIGTRIKILKEWAFSDEEYARMYAEALILENEFELALLDLPEEVQDTIWLYLFHCEAQSERLLELAMSENREEN